MKSRRIHKKLIPFLVIALTLINCIPSFADTIKYIYDDLNRLIRIEDPSGKVTEFEYDEVGNRLSKTSHEAYTITATAGANGSISPSGSVVAPYKGTLTFSITANAGYQIADVLVDGTSVGAVSSYTFNNITSNHTISTTFTNIISSLSISLNDTAGGAVTSAPAGINCGTACSNVFGFGAAVVLTATPNTGYDFTGWSGACSGTGTCSLTMNSAKTAAASFTRRSFIISASADNSNGGSISPSGNISAYYGENRSFTITPNTGYQINDVMVDSASAGAVTSYTFSNVTQNHTISAMFGCALNPVRIAGTTPSYFTSLQAAYNAAADNDIIQVQATTLSENITINRNISVTIDGGYSCDYTANASHKTLLKGMLSTQSGGGTLTIKNFVLVATAEPTTTSASTAGGVYNSTQTVTLTCGPNCDRIYYTTDGTTPTTASSIYTGPITVSQTTTLKFFAVDLAGNSGQVQTETYTLDSTPPTGTITINAGAVSTNNVNVTLALTCNDAQGCSQMQFSNDNVTYSSPEAYAATKAWTITSGDTTKIVYVKFKDTAGNWSQPCSASILFDTDVLFNEYQHITTYHAVDIEPFTIGNDTYLAVTNEYNDSTYNIDSKIYKWNGTAFAEFQSIATNRGWGLESFTIGSDTYLAVSNALNNSKIYKWNGTAFAEFQSIATSYARAWKAFTIGNDTYLAVSNLWNQTYNIDSKIYKWNGTAFAEFQSIATHGARGLESFTIGNDTYLAIANSYNDSTENIDSKIYKWNGTAFAEFQSIATYRARVWKAFTIGNDTYLAVANGSAGPRIYKWNGSAFAEFQSIGIYGAYGLESFTINNNNYLAVTNDSNDSKIYKWNGTSFAEVQSIPTHAASAWKAFIIGNDAYLAVANDESDSVIYKATTAPVIAINGGATATNNTNVILTLSCTEASGCAQMQFSNDNATYTVPAAYAATKNWVLTSGDGAKTVYVKFKDTAGNWSPAYSANILLDTVAPHTTISPDGGPYTSSLSVTLTCNDGTGSGCDKIYYTTDGSTPTTESSIYTGPITISQTTTVKFFSKDQAGNMDVVKAETYAIDATPPTATISINGGATATNNPDVTLTLSCSDAHGCSQMKFSNDNANYSSPEAYAATKAWTLTSGDGTKTAYVKFKDTMGNWSSAYSATILIDTGVPATTASPTGGTFSSAQSVTLSCNDGTGSGCDKIYYTTDGSTPTIASTVYSSPISLTASTTLKFFAMDLVGNSETVKTETYTINIPPPNPIRIGGETPTYYTTLQAAYDAANNGAVIQIMAQALIQNLNVNRNISVTVEGGYSSDFTSITGTTGLKGMIQTFTGGGTLTIKNFILQTQ